MKRALFIVGIVVFLGSEVYPAHYYRFWRGWKRGELTNPSFRNALNQVFIPETVEVGTGRGLLAYLPVIPPKFGDRPTDIAKLIPDEVALVVYKTETDYENLRNTPEGKLYGDLHWDYFDEAKGSLSLVPLPYRGGLEDEKAYDILESNADWQNGFAIYFIYEKTADPSGYIDAMKHRYSRRGLISYVVLVAEEYLIEYQLWKDQGSFENEIDSVLEKRDTCLEPIQYRFYTQKTSPYHLRLNHGEGLNAQFNHRTKVVSSPMTYAHEGIYTKMVSEPRIYGHENILGDVECHYKNASLEHPEILCLFDYYDGAGLQRGTRFFAFSKTPTGKYFVLKE